MRRIEQEVFPDIEAVFAAEYAMFQDMISDLQTGTELQSIYPDERTGMIMLRTRNPEGGAETKPLESAPLESLLLLAAQYTKHDPDATPSEFWTKSRNRQGTRTMHEYMDTNPLLQLAAMEALSGIFGTPDANMEEMRRNLALYVRTHPRSIRGAFDKYDIWATALHEGVQTEVQPMISDAPGAALPAPSVFDLPPQIPLPKSGQEGQRSHPRRRGRIVAGGILATAVVAVACGSLKSGSSDHSSASAGTETTTSLLIVEAQTTMLPSIETVPPVEVSTIDTLAPAPIATEAPTIVETDPVTTPETIATTPETDAPDPEPVEPLVIAPTDPPEVTTETSVEETAPSTTIQMNDGTLSKATCDKLGGTQFEVQPNTGLLRLFKEKFTQPDGSPIDDHVGIHYLALISVKKLLSDFRIQELMAANPDGTLNLECLPSQADFNAAVS